MFDLVNGRSTHDNVSIVPQSIFSQPLRIDVGAGYRVYYARRGQSILLLLCGGDKSTQAADIKRAIKYLGEFDRRKA